MRNDAMRARSPHIGNSTQLAVLRITRHTTHWCECVAPERSGRDVLLEQSVDREHDALMAETDVLDLPEHLLDIGIGGFRLEPRLARAGEVVLHGLAVDHGAVPVLMRRQCTRQILFCKCSCRRPQLPLLLWVANEGGVWSSGSPPWRSRASRPAPSMCRCRWRRACRPSTLSASRTRPCRRPRNASARR